MAGKGWLQRLFDACVTVLLAAVALSIAIKLVEPYLGLIVVVAVGWLVLMAWRAWQRSRW